MDQGDNRLLPLPLDWDFNIDWNLPLEGYAWGDSETKNSGIAMQPIAEASSSSLCDLSSLQRAPNNNAPQWRFNNAYWLLESADYGSSTPSFLPLTGEAIYDIGTLPSWNINSLDSIQIDHQAVHVPRNSMPYVDNGQFTDHCVQDVGTDFPNLQNSYVPVEQRDQMNSIEPSTRRQGTTKQPKVVKPRVKCTFSGCRKTFPRKYELNRHTKYVHGRTFAVFCPVYGCPRTEKALPREDKFLEHMRKHQNPIKLRCPVPDCRVGPFSRTELKVHASTHQIEDFEKVDLAITEYLHWKVAALQSGLVQVADLHECPLSSTGCKFQGLPSLLSYHVQFLMEEHIREHELRERSIGYHEIISYSGFWLHDGRASCVICPEKFMDSWNVVIHLGQHSEDQWRLHATHLYEQLAPFVEGKEHLFFLGEQKRRDADLPLAFLRNWKAENDLKLLGESDKPSTPTLLENQN